MLEPLIAKPEDHRDLVRQALLSPRGRYSATRASQLSGIPISTVYEWQRHNVYPPDYKRASPLAWSYRDLIYLRLLAWLRTNRVPRADAAAEVVAIKRALMDGSRVDIIRTDGKSILHDDQLTNQIGGQDPFQDLAITRLMDTFDLLEPLDELGHLPLWGPNLVNPSACTFISPLVMAGEPCVESTRIPTASIHALHTERGLNAEHIVRLYPALTIESVDDAIGLELRLRRAA